MISFDYHQFIDLNGKPLRGRVWFFQADTNIPEAIWYWYPYQQQYFPADNPQYTDENGFISGNIYLEEKYYSVLQQVYIGDYDDPSADPRDGVWVNDRSFYAGVIGSGGSGAGQNVVYGVSSLTNIAPSNNMVVTVVGYNTPFDCPARQYIWDSSCSAPADSGIVIESTQTSEGRWLLIPTEHILSQYYGVDANNFSNIDRLLTHTTDVSNYHYPSDIKFAKGNYTHLLPLITNHDVIVDADSKFETSQFTCGKIIIEGDKNTRNTYIGNFVPSIDCDVRTSWFKNTNPMIFCGAATHFIVDGFFGTDDLTQDEYLVNEIIIGNPGDVSNHLKKMRTVNINGGNINADREIVASGYYLSNGLRMAQSGNGAYIMPLGNLTPAIKISKGAGFDAGEVDIPSLSSDSLSAASANITHLTGTYGHFTERCSTKVFDGNSGKISDIETTAIGSEASAFIYFNHPWRTKAHDSTETWVTQYNEGIYNINSTAYTNWKFNPVHFNTNYACPIINVTYPVPKDWGFTFYNEAEPGIVASEAPSGYPVCLVLANGKNQDDTWNFKKRVVYPGQRVYFHAVTTGSFKEELY